MKRQRGRNRKPGGGNTNANSANPNRSWDSQGPENIKVRGNAQVVYERYQQLARDAGSAGDRVLAENYLQHAEHYFRVLRALQPQRPVSEIAARELSNQGFDIDFEDETGAQAAAFLAAQQAADRQQQQTEAGDRDNQERGQERSEGGQNQNGQNGQNAGGQQREWRDRPERDRDRPRNDRPDRERYDRDRPERDRPDRDDRPARVEQTAQPAEQSAQDGESREGGRRESRRERWERRRDERGPRFERDAGEGDDAVAVDPGAQALVGTPYEPAADDVVPAAAREPRRPRAPRREAEPSAEADMGLPSFLTRPTAPAAEPTGEEAAAPKKARAPRRKAAEAVADTDG